MIETKVSKGYLSFITLSTWLTLVRMALVPCIMESMILHEWGLAWMLFTIAAFTDVVDGALARFLQEETPLGAFLDPLADKLLLTGCYGTLAFVDSSYFKIPFWFVIVFTIKEVVLAFGTVYVALVKQALAIRPTLLGKMTMVVQVGFIWWLFACVFLHWVPLTTFYLFLYAITILSIGTLCHYIWIGYKGLQL
jgi:cardiolipin synthase (CMP-forming)